MNESSVSSKFQTQLRQALPGCVVIKHADKSMIGMVVAGMMSTGPTGVRAQGSDFDRQLGNRLTVFLFAEVQREWKQNCY